MVAIAQVDNLKVTEDLKREFKKNRN